MKNQKIIVFIIYFLIILVGLISFSNFVGRHMFTDKNIFGLMNWIYFIIFFRILIMPSVLYWKEKSENFYNKIKNKFN